MRVTELHTYIYNIGDVWDLNFDKFIDDISKRFEKRWAQNNSYQSLIGLLKNYKSIVRSAKNFSDNGWEFPDITEEANSGDILCIIIDKYNSALNESL